MLDGCDHAFCLSCIFSFLLIILNLKLLIFTKNDFVNDIDVKLFQFRSFCRLKPTIYITFDMIKTGVRNWRKAEGQERTNLRRCPLCRNESYFVVHNVNLYRPGFKIKFQFKC